MNDEQRAVDTRELMIRLDERLRAMQTQLTTIQTTIANKVENDKDYQEAIAKVQKMWDLKNRAMGYIAAWSAGISIAVVVGAEYLRSYFGGR